MKHAYWHGKLFTIYEWSSLLNSMIPVLVRTHTHTHPLMCTKGTERNALRGHQEACLFVSRYRILIFLVIRSCSFNSQKLGGGWRRVAGQAGKGWWKTSKSRPEKGVPGNRHLEQVCGIASRFLSGRPLFIHWSAVESPFHPETTSVSSLWPQGL